MTSSRLAAVVAAAALTLAGGAVWGQVDAPPDTPALYDERRADFDLNNALLLTALEVVSEEYGAEMRLPEDMPGHWLVTAHLRGVTLSQALGSILGPNGLVAIEENGGYVVEWQAGQNMAPPDPPPAFTMAECTRILRMQPGPEGDASDRARRDAIRRLGVIGSNEAVQLLAAVLRQPPGQLPGMRQIYRQLTLCSLGQIGGAESIAVIAEFEERAAMRYANPPPWRIASPAMDPVEAAAYDAQALSITRDDAGDDWAIFRWRMFEEEDLWMACSLGEGLWDCPILIRIDQDTQRWQRGRFALEFRDGRFEFTSVTPFWLHDSLADRDNDGLPDLIEHRMMTDASSADSDGDGMPDGTDSNPLTPKADIADDDAMIRQAVFTLFYATSDSRAAIGVTDEVAVQEFRGSLGPVLRVQRPRWGMECVARMPVVYRPDSTAYCALALCRMCGMGSDPAARLRKTHGRWVVTQFSTASG